MSTDSQSTIISVPKTENAFFMFLCFSSSCVFGIWQKYSQVFWEKNDEILKKMENAKENHFVNAMK